MTTGADKKTLQVALFFEILFFAILPEIIVETTITIKFSYYLATPSAAV